MIKYYGIYSFPNYFIFKLDLEENQYHYSVVNKELVFSSDKISLPKIEDKLFKEPVLYGLSKSYCLFNSIEEVYDFFIKESNKKLQNLEENIKSNNYNLSQVEDYLNFFLFD